MLEVTLVSGGKEVIRGRINSATSLIRLVQIFYTEGIEIDEGRVVVGNKETDYLIIKIVQ